MHTLFSWGYMAWMTIAWLLVVGLVLTLVWSIVLAASLHFQERKSSGTNLKRRDTDDDIDMDEYTRRLEELEKDRKAA